MTKSLSLTANIRFWQIKISFTKTLSLRIYSLLEKNHLVEVKSSRSHQHPGTSPLKQIQKPLSTPSTVTRKSIIKKRILIRNQRKRSGIQQKRINNRILDFQVGINC